VLPAERPANCSDGVELVGLGGVAAGRTVDLDDPLALLEQIRREPRARSATGGSTIRTDGSARIRAMNCTVQPSAASSRRYVTDRTILDRPVGPVYL